MTHPMLQIHLNSHPTLVSHLVYGCMRIGGTREPTPIDDAQRRVAYGAIEAALEAGYTCFDHADFYRRHKSELVFGDFLREHPGVRERIFIQSKCGMRGDFFDASAEHLRNSVEGSLRRLGIERLEWPRPGASPRRPSSPPGSSGIRPGSSRWWGAVPRSASTRPLAAATSPSQEPIGTNC